MAVTAKEADISPDELVELPVVVTQADLYIALSKIIADNTVAKRQNILDSLILEKDTDGKTVYDKILAEYDESGFVQSLLE